MQVAEAWRSLFENWPDTVPRQGILVTSYADTVPFRDFMISGAMLLVEREVPDSSGARKVILPYANIAGLKLTNTMELARFQVMGFQSPF